MKKFYVIVAMAFVAMISMSFVANSNVGANAQKFNIIGAWSLVYDEYQLLGYSPDYKAYVLFKDDGTSLLINDDRGRVTVDTATWSVSGTNFTMTLTSGEWQGQTVNSTIPAEKTDKFSMFVQINVTLERVSEKVVKKYL